MSLVVGLGVGEIPVGLSQPFTNVFACGLSALCGLDVVLLEILEIDVANHEAGWDYVILVNVLNEGLHAGFPLECFFAYSPLHVSGVASNSHEQQVGESVFLHHKCRTLLPSS